MIMCICVYLGISTLIIRAILIVRAWNFLKRWTDLHYGAILSKSTLIKAFLMNFYTQSHGSWNIATFPVPGIIVPERGTGTQRYDRRIVDGTRLGTSYQIEPDQ
jgi:hypothetical protein